MDWWCENIFKHPSWAQWEPVLGPGVMGRLYTSKNSQNVENSFEMQFFCREKKESKCQEKKSRAYMWDTVSTIMIFQDLQSTIFQYITVLNQMPSVDEFLRLTDVVSVLAHNHSVVVSIWTSKRSLHCTPWAQGVHTAVNRSPNWI